MRKPCSGVWDKVGWGEAAKLAGVESINPIKIAPYSAIT